MIHSQLQIFELRKDDFCRSRLWVRLKSGSPQQRSASNDA